MDELYIGINGFVRRISPEEQAFIKGEYTKKRMYMEKFTYDSWQTILDNEHFGQTMLFMIWFWHGEGGNTGVFKYTCKKNGN